MVVRTWIIDEKETTYVRFYISRLVSHAERILQAARKHWATKMDCIGFRMWL